MGTTCRRCSFIRFFLMAAVTLMIGIYFFPDVSTRYGRVMPTPLEIAMIVPAFGIPMFIVKYVRYRMTGH